MADTTAARAVPIRVAREAGELRLGDLVARHRLPDMGIHVALWCGWGVLFAAPVIVVPLLVLLGVLPGSADVGQSIVTVVVFGAAAIFCLWQGIGRVTTQALYLYPRGYVATTPFGRVRRANRWTDVYDVEVTLDPMQAIIATRPVARRNNCAILNRSGKPIRFRERVDRSVVGPLARQLFTAEAR